jgi:Na+-translocating ferredoxin:NAD+ oxidoreductase RnfC subunit
VHYPQGARNSWFTRSPAGSQSGGLPLDSGVIVANVRQRVRLCRAVYEGRPIVTAW